MKESFRRPTLVTLTHDKIYPVIRLLYLMRLTDVKIPYIDEVPIENLQDRHIFIDGGKRMKETKRLKYQQLLSNFRDPIGIAKIENTLSNHNSRTCDYDDFIESIKHKLEINELVMKKYQETKFRQYKWYVYLNKKRAEDNMLNQIEHDYGKDSITIMGDWSVGKQMRHFIAIVVGIRRRFSIVIYNIKADLKDTVEI